MGNKKKVVVGLSGGVDSAVSAYILLKAGFDVTGIFLKVYEDTNQIFSECPWREDIKAAQEVAQFLQIPFETWNFSKEYKSTVLEYFFSELKKGRTPNPDVFCNNEIKFGFFLSKVLEKKFDFLATGHYVQTYFGINQDAHLIRGVDENKDQSYFLSRLTQSMLSHSLFPIGHLTKHAVRSIATDIHLPNALRKDSQGICFIGNINVSEFIKKNLALKSGVIKTTKGNVIGMHKGLELYTIGQRHGIEIGGGKEPFYVVKKDTKRNELWVAQGKDNKALFSTRAIVCSMHWLHGNPPHSKHMLVQIRYRQKAIPALLQESKSNSYEVLFDAKQRAVTPGQVCAFYEGNECLGSGIIES